MATSLVSAAIGAAAHLRASAFPLAVLAGSLSTAGPCFAPRYAAVVALCGAQTRRRRLLIASCFVLGTAFVYAAFALGFASIARSATRTGAGYAIVACVLAIAGFCALLRGGDDSEAHDCAGPTSRGAAFFLGSCFALIFSPCCTPVAGAILAYGSAAGSPAYVGLLLFCYAVGHGLPLCALAAGSEFVLRIPGLHVLKRQFRLISAAIMLAFSGYYALLV